MVKIINKEPHESVVKETICSNCGATLQYIPNDVKVSRNWDKDGGFTVEESIVCPNCHKRHILR